MKNGKRRWATEETVMFRKTERKDGLSLYIVLRILMALHREAYLIIFMVVLLNCFQILAAESQLLQCIKKLLFPSQRNTYHQESSSILLRWIS